MPREELVDIVAGQEAWDEDVNGNTAKLRDKPSMLFEHDGDETDLETTWPAADWPNCQAAYTHSGGGLRLAWSNGVAWVRVSTTTL